MSQSIQIIVRYSSQAYNCRVGKVSASSTSDARTAAKRLAQKLYGDDVQSVTFAAADTATHTEAWTIAFKERAAA